MTVLKAKKLAAIAMSLGGLVLLVSGMYAGYHGLLIQFVTTLVMSLYCWIIFAAILLQIQIDSRFDELKKYLEERQIRQESK